MTAAVYRAVADPARRTILDLLRAGERAVLELLPHFDFSQPALSKHLRVLLDAGLVTRRKDGRESRYRLDARGLQAVYDWVGHYELFWSDRLDRLGGVLDELGTDKLGRVEVPPAVDASSEPMRSPKRYAGPKGSSRKRR